jgi:hypothetical protein
VWEETSARPRVHCSAGGRSWVTQSPKCPPADKLHTRPMQHYDLFQASGVRSSAVTMLGGYSKPQCPFSHVVTKGKQLVLYGLLCG